MCPSKQITISTKIVKNVFIDANVIAKWLLFHSLLNKLPTIKEKDGYKKKCKISSEKYQKRLFYSYEFMEQIIKKSFQNYIFFTSSLVMTEVFKVLFDRHMLGYMNRNLIPLEEIHRVRREDKFPVGTFLEIYSANEKHFNKINNTLKMAGENKDVFKSAGVFVSEHGILTQDSHLLAQAIYESCFYFVTNDTELTDKFGSVKEDIRPKIIAVTPERFFREVKEK